jgi:hypothetical protein
MDVTKILANNILEFLIDPTRVPVEKRVYFRPEEQLDNSVYEKAKEEAYKIYKDERHNSDGYPTRDRSIKQGVSIMNRKSLIASLDILSKNFKEDDVFAVELRTMATAVSKLPERDLTNRMASDAPEIEAALVQDKKCEECGKDPCECKAKEAGKKCDSCGKMDAACTCEASVEAAKTFKCPKCGTKVLEATGYCIKCKAKVKPGKKASEDSEFWTREAATSVMQALVADLDIESEDSSPTPAPEPEPEPEPDNDDEAPKKKAPVDNDESEPISEPAPVQAEIKKEAAVEIKVEPEKKADENKKAETSVVNTDVLASYNFGGVELDAALITSDDVGELSTEEKARLEQLF